MNVYMQDLILVILAKTVIILKLESMNIRKKTKNLIYINIYAIMTSVSQVFNSDWFSILDYTRTQFQLKSMKVCVLIGTSQILTNNSTT